MNLARNAYLSYSARHFSDLNGRTGMIQTSSAYEQAIQALRSLGTKDAVSVIAAAAKQRPELRDHTIVALSEINAPDDLNLRTMYGRSFEGENGKQVIVHPYEKYAAGVNVVPTYTDKATGEIYLLLTQKYKNPRDHAEGPADEYITIGGYGAPHAAPKARESDINTVLPQELRDRAEEIVASSNADYKTVLDSLIQENPALAARVAPKPYDNSLSDTAIRELKEESGLDLKALGLEEKLISLGSADSRFDQTHTDKIHIIREHFTVDLSSLDKLPPNVKAADDAAALTWIPVSAIQFAPENPKRTSDGKDSPYSITVPDPNTGVNKTLPLRADLGPVIENAVRTVRGTEFEQENQISISSIDETFQHWVNTAEKMGGVAGAERAKALIPQKPKTQFSSEAILYYNNLSQHVAPRFKTNDNTIAAAAIAAAGRGR